MSNRLLGQSESWPGLLPRRTYVIPIFVRLYSLLGAGRMNEVAAPCCMVAAPVLSTLLCRVAIWSLRLLLLERVFYRITISLLSVSL
jgi:hypothetical protein